MLHNVLRICNRKILLILIYPNIILKSTLSFGARVLCKYSIFLYFGIFFREKNYYVPYIYRLALLYVAQPYRPHVFNFIEKNSRFLFSGRLEKLYVFNILPCYVYFTLDNVFKGY